MTRVKIIAAAALLGTSGFAMAQTAGTTSANTNTAFGATVRGLAHDQHNGTTATTGIGTTVSGKAHARNAARQKNSDTDTDEATEQADSDNDKDGTDSGKSSSAFGRQVSALAKGQHTDSTSTKGIGSTVRDLPKPSEVASTRAAAESSRSDAASARTTATDARQAAKETAQQAKEVRQTVQSVRPGRGH